MKEFKEAEKNFNDANTLKLQTETHIGSIREKVMC